MGTHIPLAAEVAALARKTRDALAAVQMVVFDFDGVFTDNRVHVFEDGRELVSCWRSDGLGLSRLRDAGLQLQVISTEVNPVVAARCEKLKLPCVQGCDDKLSALRQLTQEHGVGMPRVAFVGNDINDLPCLSEVGCPIVVLDAHPDVVSIAAYRTRNPGGRGAVREVCDLLVEARNKQI